MLTIEDFECNVYIESEESSLHAAIFWDYNTHVSSEGVATDATIALM